MNIKLKTGEIRESENIRETLKESWEKTENREIWSIKIYNQIFHRRGDLGRGRGVPLNPSPRVTTVSKSRNMRGKNMNLGGRSEDKKEV